MGIGPREIIDMIKSSLRFMHKHTLTSKITFIQLFVLYSVDGIGYWVLGIGYDLIEKTLN